MSERRSPKGPAPLRSRAEVAAAGVRVAEQDGLPAVTMRRVAAELGTGPGSLYRYVASRDDLLDLMVDQVTAELDLDEPGGDWAADVVTLGRALLALHRRHPWLVDVRQQASTPGPHVVDHLEHGLALLAPVEVPVRAKLEALALVTGIVTLFARQQQAGTAIALTADPARWPQLTAALAGAVPDAQPAPDLFDRVLVGAVRGVLGVDESTGALSRRPGR